MSSIKIHGQKELHPVLLAAEKEGLMKEEEEHLATAVFYSEINISELAGEQRKRKGHIKAEMAVSYISILVRHLLITRLGKIGEVDKGGPPVYHHKVEEVYGRLLQHAVMLPNCVRLRIHLEKIEFPPCIQEPRRGVDEK